MEVTRRILRQARGRLRADFRTIAIVAVICVFASGIARSETESGPCCHQFDFVLKKTLFRIDVFRLKIVLDEQTGRDVEKIVVGQKRTRDLENAVAVRFLEAPFAEATVEPKRSISYERFIDGFSKTQMRIAEYGLFDEITGRETVDDTASRYSFLKERGMEKGDRLRFVLRGDSLFSTYTRADGTVELDDIRVGPEARSSLLGSYVVPKTDFSDGLLDQLFKRLKQAGE